MPLRYIKWAFAGVFLLLNAACSAPSDNQTALEKAAHSLQQNLTTKHTSEVMRLLHPQFLAQQQHDKQWAENTMRLLFLRHNRVQVIALSSHSMVDANNPDRGVTEAQVALTGAKNLLPDSADHMQVKLQWWLVDGQWRLARLDWE